MMRGWQGRIAMLVVVVTAAAVLAACGDDNSSSKRSKPELSYPATAPAFDADYLTELPREHWITNGGSVANQRYSPLDEINDSNVQDLKAEWKVDLKSATQSKYSHETQPIVYDGVIYVSTGEDDVFAIDAKTAETKWKYEGNLDPKISTVCCGWLNRGVAIGDGRVYLGRLDGHMVALDQKTGDVVWDSPVTDWLKQNGGITAAPLYYDGMVYSGITGGEFGVRGRVVALDATTGKEQWHFDTTAGPDDPVGGKTWPADEKAYLSGGAPVWQTPSVDPKLGMIYFTTGNANPDVDGSGREGDNLYSASFVALDLKTGEYKWHYQTVHHDIWDYDQPSPTIQFDVEKDGKTVHAIAQAAKTGWVYALDRKTGEPVWPIKETPVPQDPQQKTSATQPIPQYEPFADHHIDDAEYQAIVAQVKANPEGKGIKVLKPASDDPADVVFSPPHLDGKSVTVIANGPTGGTNWPPSSYSPKTKYMYVCSLNGVAGMYPSGVEDFKPGAVRLGSLLTVQPFGETPGQLTAIDTSDGSTAWKVDFPESCYSGSVATAGNLVFVGRNSGLLEAYSADKGEKLWEFQTGAGANSTVTVFEQDGKEKIAFVAGGNSLAFTPHGDNLWLFSLDGKGESQDGIDKGSEAGGVNHFDEAPTTPSSDDGGKDQGTQAADGAELFSANCSICHGATGTGGNGGPNITSQSDIARNIAQITHGGGGMPAFGDQLSDEEIKVLATFVANSLGQ